MLYKERFKLQKKIYKDETDVKKTVKDILLYYQLYYFMPVASGYSKVGTTDFAGILPNGIFLGIETKCLATKGKTSIAQKETITLINNKKGVALVVDETKFELLIDIIENAVEGRVIK